MASSNEEKAAIHSGMTEKKLKNLPDKTVIRFSMQFSSQRGKIFTYAAIKIGRDWYSTGFGATQIHDVEDFGRWIDANGVGDIEFLLPVEGVTGGT